MEGRRDELLRLALFAFRILHRLVGVLLHDAHASAERHQRLLQRRLAVRCRHGAGGGVGGSLVAVLDTEAMQQLAHRAQHLAPCARIDDACGGELLQHERAVERRWLLVDAPEKGGSEGRVRQQGRGR